MPWAPGELTASRQVRRASGLCLYCSNYAENGSVCCDHWFMQLAKRMLGRATMANARILKETFVASRARCFYTGVELTFKTACAVHQVPVSRGGRRSSDNIAWTTATVGHMKGEMTPEEFRELCARVAGPPVSPA